MRKSFLLLAALLLCLCAFSAAAEGKTWTNPETGYRAILEDDIDLLTAEQEDSIMENMKKLTDYTNAAFWSTQDARTQSQAIRNAEDKHISLFGHYVNGIVFMIDMNVRYMFLDTEGWIQEVIPKSTAEIITNNVRSSMSGRKYYSATKTVFEQVQAKINGEKIAEPMRYLSAAAIGIMGGLLFALVLIVGRRNLLNPVYTKAAGAAVFMTVNILSLTNMTLHGSPKEKRTYSPRSSDSSGCSSCSSCSSCSGGSSCSSCGGGSSCSSCGGGSSF